MDGIVVAMGGAAMPLLPLSAHRGRIGQTVPSRKRANDRGAAVVDILVAVALVERDAVRLRYRRGWRL